MFLQSVWNSKDKHNMAHTTGQGRAICPFVQNMEIWTPQCQNTHTKSLIVYFIN